MERGGYAGCDRDGRLLPVTALQDCGLAMMLWFPSRKVQHRLPFRIFGPNLVECCVRFGKARICFAPEVEQCFVLLFGATLVGSVERLGDKIRKWRQRFVTVRNAESKSTQEV